MVSGSRFPASSATGIGVVFRSLMLVEREFEVFFAFVDADVLVGGHRGHPDHPAAHLEAELDGVGVDAADVVIQCHTAVDRDREPADGIVDGGDVGDHAVVVGLDEGSPGIRRRGPVGDAADADVAREW